ncbi:survival protein sure-like phosphatase/nucleotidase [Schizophyllum commune]
MGIAAVATGSNAGSKERQTNDGRRRERRRRREAEEQKITRRRRIASNDDGPPSSHESPYVFGLYKHLTNDLGFNVRVVLPSSQKSWIGKAFHIKEIVTGQYYYPTEPYGYGETSEVSRPLKEGEVAEWILLNGTPATCANVGLYNLYRGEIDYVISGPNLGRNSSAAFAMSSGTIGAALSGALTGARALALSYGTVVHPTPEEWLEPAHQLAMRIIKELLDGWDTRLPNKATHGNSLYNINIPLISELLAGDGLPVYWTTLWRNSYSALFKAIPPPGPTADAQPTARDVPAAGPDAPEADPKGEAKGSVAPNASPLAFKWSPVMEGIVRPDLATVPEGSDAWAIHKGYASVTPLHAAFAEPVGNGGMALEDRKWKL